MNRLKQTIWRYDSKLDTLNAQLAIECCRKQCRSLPEIASTNTQVSLSSPISLTSCSGLIRRDSILLTKQKFLLVFCFLCLLQFFMRRHHNKHLQKRKQGKINKHQTLFSFLLYLLFICICIFFIFTIFSQFLFSASGYVYLHYNFYLHSSRFYFLRVLSGRMTSISS